MLPLDRGAHEFLAIGEVAEDRTMRHTRTLGYLGNTRMAVTRPNKIEICIDHRILVPVATSPSAIFIGGLCRFRHTPDHTRRCKSARVVVTVQLSESSVMVGSRRHIA
jgi:hypothetical protein